MSECEREMLKNVKGAGLLPGWGRKEWGEGENERKKRGIRFYKRACHVA